MRNIPATPHDAMTQPILDYASRELLPKMRAVASEADIAFEMGLDLPAFGIEADAPVVRWAMELAQTSRLGTGAVSFATEAPVFQRAGIPTVVMGPGSIDQAHKPDEFITLDQVAACEQFFGRLIESRPPGTSHGEQDPGLEVVRAACPHDCPDTCAMLVTVRRDNGKRVAIKVAGDPSHPTTAGTLCTKVSRYLERTYHPDRLLHPLKRVGRKGEGRFERVSWDQALDDIAARLKTVAAVDSQRIVPYSYAGTMGMVQGERWRAVSSTGSARASSIARSAPPLAVRH